MHILKISSENKYFFYFQKYSLSIENIKIIP
jgi:hypothetical protein